MAISTELLSREAAIESLSVVRHVLSVIPVKEPVQVPAPGSGVTFDQSLVHAWWDLARWDGPRECDLGAAEGSDRLSLTSCPPS